MSEAQVAAEARDWKDLFWSVFSLSSNPIALHDRRRVFVEANAALWKLLGGSRTDIVGRKIDDFLPRKERARSASDWRQFWQVGNYAGTRHVFRLDGEPVFIQFAGRICRVGGRRFAVVVFLETQMERDLVRPPGAQGPLTAREREVVHLVALGYEGPQIAEKLMISRDTVRVHMRNAMAKTGARTRAQLVAIALADRYIDPARAVEPEPP